MKPFAAFATTALTVLSLASGIAVASAADLVIGLKEPSPTLDPHYMTSPAAAQITTQIFEPIVARDNDNVIVPKLADVSPIK